MGQAGYLRPRKVSDLKIYKKEAGLIIAIADYLRQRTPVWTSLSNVVQHFEAKGWWKLKEEKDKTQMIPEI